LNKKEKGELSGSLFFRLKGDSMKLSVKEVELSKELDKVTITAVSENDEEFTLELNDFIIGCIRNALGTIIGHLSLSDFLTVSNRNPDAEDFNILKGVNAVGAGVTELPEINEEEGEENG
jgi:hypothetical protein